jgi:hypothetical protein
VASVAFISCSVRTVRNVVCSTALDRELTHASQVLMGEPVAVHDDGSRMVSKVLTVRPLAQDDVHPVARLIPCVLIVDHLDWVDVDVDRMPSRVDVVFLVRSCVRCPETVAAVALPGEAIECAASTSCETSQPPSASTSQNAQSCKV